MRKKLKIVAINVGILLIGIVVIELIFGGWINSKNSLNNLGIIRDVSFEYDVSNLYQTDTPTIQYTRDIYGLRGVSSFNDPTKIDILTIGGSTTDQRYIDDNKTWQEVLQQEFQKNNVTLHVSNAGVDGQSTYGHLKSFELWLSKIPGLQPDYILFYVGINDFYKVKEDATYDDIALLESNGLKAQIKNKSVFYNLYRKLRGMQTAKKHNIGHHKVDFSNFKYTDTLVLDHQLEALYNSKNLKLFKKRLKKLIDYSKEMNAEPIFITQPSFNFKLENGKIVGIEDMNYIDDTYAYNGLGYYTLLTNLNEAIKEVAADKYAVIDLTENTKWEASDFYDFYHMTEVGAKKLGKKIYEGLRNKISN